MSGSTDVITRVGSSPAERGGCGGSGHCRGGCAGRYPGLAARTARWAGSALAHRRVVPRRRGPDSSCWQRVRNVLPEWRLLGSGHGLSGLRAVGTAADPLTGGDPTTHVSGARLLRSTDTLARDGRRFRESADPCRADPGSLRAVGRTCPHSTSGCIPRPLWNSGWTSR